MTKTGWGVNFYGAVICVNSSRSSRRPLLILGWRLADQSASRGNEPREFRECEKVWRAMTLATSRLVGGVLQQQKPVRFAVLVRHIPEAGFAWAYDGPGVGMSADPLSVRGRTASVSVVALSLLRHLR